MQSDLFYQAEQAPTSSSFNVQNITLSDGQVYLLQNCFSQAQDELIQEKLSQLNWQQVGIELYGKQVKTPRQQCFYGDDGVSYQYSKTRFFTQAWQAPLVNLKRYAEQQVSVLLQQNVDFNAVLANLYRDGRDNMGWHADDEAELGKEPVIASFSFGAARNFKFKHRYNGQIIDLILPSTSLLIMSGKTQEFWYHALPKRVKVVAPRYNLTYRRIYT